MVSTGSVLDLYLLNANGIIVLLVTTKTLPRV